MYPQFKLKTFIRPQDVIWISQICKYAQLDSWSSQNASAWEKCWKSVSTKPNGKMRIQY